MTRVKFTLKIDLIVILICFSGILAYTYYTGHLNLRQNDGPMIQIQNVSFDNQNQQVMIYLKNIGNRPAILYDEQNASLNAHLNINETSVEISNLFTSQAKILGGETARISVPAYDFEAGSLNKVRIVLADGFFAETLYLLADGLKGNQAPIARLDHFTAIVNKQLEIKAPGVLGNDHDPERKKITASKMSDPQHGTLDFHSNGSLTYLPFKDYSGPDSFTYIASDGLAQSDVQTVQITVSTMNHRPVVNDDSYGIYQNETLKIEAPGFLANDYDPDGDTLYAIQMDPFPSWAGTLIMDSDGSFTYTPPKIYLPSVAFTYTANDGTLNFTDPEHDMRGFVTIFIGSTDPNFLHAENDTYSTKMNTPLNVTEPGVLGNDIDQYPLSEMKAIIISDTLHGIITLNGDGSFLYVPDRGYSGSDSFSYHLEDLFFRSNMANVIITILP
jgi:hypothetical protein